MARCWLLWAAVSVHPPSRPVPSTLCTLGVLCGVVQPSPVHIFPGPPRHEQSVIPKTPLYHLPPLPAAVAHQSVSTPNIKGELSMDSSMA